MIIYSMLTTYMMAATIYSLVRSFQAEQTSGVYAQLIISMASTYGVYMLSSLLALDPWHMWVSLARPSDFG
jgi:chitin synthase